MMMCHNPYTTASGQAYGCGQCLSCRINRRRIWAHRIKLECKEYKENAFVTLTYAQRFPEDMSLRPKRLKRFTDLLNHRSKRLLGSKMRYFAVGEYGDEGMRPHFHLVLFGYPACERWPTPRLRPKYNKCCAHCDFIGDIWPEGRIQVEPMSDGLAHYIGGYVTKKLTDKSDLRLNGTYPEFARPSKGIGKGAMHDVADVILRYYDMSTGAMDVPVALNHGRKAEPLGRYLRQQLRKMTGVNKDGKAPQVAVTVLEEKMRPLLEAARADKENPSYKAKVKEKFEGAVRRREALSKIYKQRRSL